MKSFRIVYAKEQRYMLLAQLGNRYWKILHAKMSMSRVWKLKVLPFAYMKNM
jgi:hypothetical protein